MHAGGLDPELENLTNNPLYLVRKRPLQKEGRVHLGLASRTCNVYSPPPRRAPSLV